MQPWKTQQLEILVYYTFSSNFQQWMRAVLSFWTLIQMRESLEFILTTSHKFLSTQMVLTMSRARDTLTPSGSESYCWQVNIIIADFFLNQTNSGQFLFSPLKILSLNQYRTFVRSFEPKKVQINQNKDEKSYQLQKITAIGNTG